MSEESAREDYVAGEITLPDAKLKSSGKAGKGGKGFNVNSPTYKRIRADKNGGREIQFKIRPVHDRSRNWEDFMHRREGRLCLSHSSGDAADWKMYDFDKKTGWFRLCLKKHGWQCFAGGHERDIHIAPGFHDHWGHDGWFFRIVDDDGEKFRL